MILSPQKIRMRKNAPGFSPGAFSFNPLTARRVTDHAPESLRRSLPQIEEPRAPKGFCASAENFDLREEKSDFSRRIFA